MAAAIVVPGGAFAWAALGAWPAGVGLMFLGLIVGVVPSVLFAGYLARRHLTGSLVPIAVVLSGAASGVALLHLLNGALDRDPGRVTRGAVVIVNGVGTSRGGEAQVRWADGTTEWVRGSRSLREGERVERTTHQGALGFEWTQGSW